jgi:glycosyltransferase involved in cell wall biosynthesis
VQQRRLRLCILLPSLAIGGAEMQVLQFVKNVDKSLVSTSLCCFARGNPELEREAEPYVGRIHSIEFHWRFFPLAFLRLVTYLRRGKFDILHCHLPVADSIGRLAGWIAGVPVLITTEHGKNLWKPWIYLLLERLLNRITDLRICVSHDIMEIRKRRERVPCDKLAYLPNAVDLDAFRKPGRQRAEVMAEFGWPPEDPLVVSVGRLVAEKNYELLVDAIAILRERVPGLRCLIAGEGKCRARIAQRIEALMLTESVRLPGPRGDIPDLLHAADVFVLSSLREGLPVSLIEAMAAGKAIVATAVGGMLDAITTGENGLLVPSGDADEIAAAVESLIGSPNLRRELGEAASKTANDRFDIRRFVERTQEIYLSLCEKEGIPVQA